MYQLQQQPQKTVQLLKSQNQTTNTKAAQNSLIVEGKPPIMEFRSISTPWGSSEQTYQTIQAKSIQLTGDKEEDVYKQEIEKLKGVVSAAKSDPGSGKKDQIKPLMKFLNALRDKDLSVALIYTITKDVMEIDVSQRALYHHFKESKSQETDDLLAKYVMKSYLGNNKEIFLDLRSKFSNPDSLKEGTNSANYLKDLFQSLLRQRHSPYAFEEAFKKIGIITSDTDFGKIHTEAARAKRRGEGVSDEVYPKARYLPILNKYLTAFEHEGDPLSFIKTSNASTDQNQPSTSQGVNEQGRKRRYADTTEATANKKPKFGPVSFAGTVLEKYNTLEKMSLKYLFEQYTKEALDIDDDSILSICKKLKNDTNIDVSLSDMKVILNKEED